MKARLLRMVATAGLLLGLAPPALAAPVPFEATYRLAIDGWPDAHIQHRLSRNGGVWQIRMKARITIAKGQARSRLRLDDDGQVQALDYKSSYSLLGFGDDYHLDNRALARLPDRQTALFALSRRVGDAHCTRPEAPPCSLRYLDPDGEVTTLKYRVLGRNQAKLPAGRFPRILVDTWESADSDHHLTLGFHPDVPGLLLNAEYYRKNDAGKDERQSQLRLEKLQLDAPADRQR